MKNKYRVAIIGCGWMGLGAQLELMRPKPASHAEAVAMNDHCELVALVETKRDNRVLATRLYPKASLYTGATQMIDVRKPDIVIISTTPESHADLIALCAELGVKAVLCEKPIAHNMESARMAVDSCIRGDTLLFVNHVRRFDPLIRQWQEYLTSGYVQDTYIGSIRHATSYYHKGLFHSGTHNVDLLRFFLGEVRWVSAVENRYVPKIDGDISVEATLGFDNAIAHLQLFDERFEYKLSETNFFGPRGSVRLTHMTGLEIEVVGTYALSHFSDTRELDYKHKRVFGEARSFYSAPLQHIVNCLKGLESPLSTGQDELKTLQVLMSLKESAEKKGVQILV